MIPTAQPLSNEPPYEVYPGVSPPDFAQWFLRHKQITLEAFCKNEGIDFDALPGLVDEVLVEWELKGERHHTYSDAVAHMINHLRIKKNAKRNNQRRRLNAPCQDTGRVSEDLEVAQAILRRINPGKGY